MGKKQTSQIPNILLSVKDASVAISVSSKMVRLLIASGRLKAVNLGKRMTRISLQELTDFAQRQGSTTANNHLVKLKAALRMAYEDGHIKENIAKKLVKAKGHGNKRQYLTKVNYVISRLDENKDGGEHP